MTATPDYKSTIRLPQTEFPMKGDLPLKEPKIIQNWEEKKIYQKMVAKNAGKKRFVLPDGPPYANGGIHLGHALNKTLKDVIIKYKNMRGLQTVFIPGWDCHGLPIEHKVLKDLQAKKITKTDQEILALCREEAQKWVGVQREDFRRLGILADWENPYLTMQPAYEAEEVREFARSFQKGLIYRGVKPVYWNWVLKTALADAEVEYHNHKSPSIYVKFPITDAATLKKLGNPSKPTNMVIWTTTPWTLPANTGIALHPELEYSVYDGGTENYVIAKGLKESVEKDTGLVLTEGFTFKGEDLELGKARHPWIDRDSIIVLGLHVSLDAGTGAVHTAPGHGADDFKVGLTYKLPILNPVDDAGLYTDEVPEYKGINIFKANPLIVEKLKESGHLLAHKEIEHSYPHCWRSKAPLIFRTTPQWFIGLDLEGSNIRAKTMKAIDGIKFVPQWGEARFRSMMENRPDWCLSRQRLWGVPIPVFTCNATNETLADFDVMMKVADVIEAEGGISAFTANDPTKFISAEAIENARKKSGNPQFGTQGFRHGRDILDVWFDSGVCHAAVQKKREGMGFPADLYLEGSDQHRGWFNTSLLSSMCTNGEAPFKALLTHGFTLDSQGRKMSKSLGNSVEPQEVSSKSGAEIIRLWTSYGDYGKDMSCGKAELDRVTETYRRIRNSMRYLLGATSDFDPAKDIVPYEKLTWVDKWALSRLASLHKEVTEAYDNYEFYKIYHALNIFFTVDLSATYMDVLKDRLYTWKHDGVPRRGSQTVLYYMADYLIRMMAPILSFLAEESYGYLKADPKAESVFLLDYPEVPAQWTNPEIAANFEEYLKVRGDVQKVLEGLRTEKVIGSSLEAKVIVHSEGELFKKLQNYADLREFLIVSDVELKNGPYKVEAVKASGEKCVRCWVYSTEISQDPKHPGICPKCVEALS
ncbi:isoleucine--tRNA ligase [Bdellovibrio sp.]|uniref:isoleucine--tRNA ligase n=1 Tax=Bdellovibrio sp. TaxID=28201 RepID=UPI0039E3BF4F